jgi:hypothetical protein
VQAGYWPEIFNNDGNADLLVSYGDSNIWFPPGQGDGSFGTALSCPIAGSISLSAIADINGDGKRERRPIQAALKTSTPAIR